MFWNQHIVSDNKEPCLADNNQYIDSFYFTARKLVRKAASHVEENIFSDKDWWKKILAKKQKV